MIKGIIFDLDGTTLNTLEDITKSVNEVLSDYKRKPLTVDEVRQKVGWGFKKLIENILPDIDEDKIINEAIEKFTKYYNLNYAIKTKPYEGMKEVIDTLITKGIKVGINSNKKDEYTKRLVQINYPNINQEFVFGKREGFNAKPDPINNIELLKRMNLKNDEVLYIGDSKVDYETGINSNIKTIIVLWGFRTKEELKELKPYKFIEDPKQILEEIKNG